PQPLEPTGCALVQPITQGPGEVVPVASEPTSQFSPLNGSPQPPPCWVPAETFLPSTHRSFLPATSASRMVFEVPSVMDAMGPGLLACKTPPSCALGVPPRMPHRLLKTPLVGS